MPTPSRFVGPVPAGIDVGDPTAVYGFQSTDDNGNPLMLTNPNARHNWAASATPPMAVVHLQRAVGTFGPIPWRTAAVAVKRAARSVGPFTDVTTAAADVGPGDPGKFPNGPGDGAYRLLRGLPTPAGGQFGDFSDTEFAPPLQAGPYAPLSPSFAYASAQVNGGTYIQDPALGAPSFVQMPGGRPSAARGAAFATALAKAQMENQRVIAAEAAIPNSTHYHYITLQPNVEALARARPAPPLCTPADALEAVRTDRAPARHTHCAHAQPARPRT